jgi:hypothetical protein
MDITKLELWELWKLAYEQLALLSQTQNNLTAIQAEIAKREKEKEEE